MGRMAKGKSLQLNTPVMWEVGWGERTRGSKACLPGMVTVSKDAGRDWRDGPVGKVLVCKHEDLSLVFRTPI